MSKKLAGSVPLYAPPPCAKIVPSWLRVEVEIIARAPSLIAIAFNKAITRAAPPPPPARIASRILRCAAVSEGAGALLGAAGFAAAMVANSSSVYLLASAVKLCLYTFC